jgi:hypothetical protein
MMDINCHVLTGRLSRALTQESIGLREITKDHLGSLCPNTHASGSEHSMEFGQLQTSLSQQLSGYCTRNLQETIEPVCLISQHYQQFDRSSAR